MQFREVSGERYAPLTTLNRLMGALEIITQYIGQGPQNKKKKKKKRLGTTILNQIQINRNNPFNSKLIFSRKKKKVLTLSRPLDVPVRPTPRSRSVV